MGNSNKKNSSIKDELKENDCYTDRKTVITVNNKEGEIFLIDSVNFGIWYQGNNKPLLPCNLPVFLQKAGKKIFFSGAVKETKLEELWAGEPFVITKLEER